MAERDFFLEQQQKFWQSHQLEWKQQLLMQRQHQAGAGSLPAESTTPTRCQKRHRTSSEASTASSTTPTGSSGAKRGRPSAETVQRLIEEGLSNPDAKNKCEVCGRSFDRAKALKNHVMAHNRITPHRCTFPGCSKVATQSGNKKTHERRHAGDYMFICPHPGCGKEYMHTNRECPHEVEGADGVKEIVKVGVVLRPDKFNMLRPDLKECVTPEQFEWLAEYAKKNNKIYVPPSTPARPVDPVPPAAVRTPKKPQRARKELDVDTQENITPPSNEPREEDVQPAPPAAVRSPKRPQRARKELDVDIQENITPPSIEPREQEQGGTFACKLKRRWLIQAHQESTRRLAVPLEWSEPNQDEVQVANLSRPTVIVGVEPINESDDEQRAALALIALSTADSPANRLSNSPKKIDNK
ncbi:uncharacterized protein LOC135939530 [Cloeon dipterum]|uniref:uncharacterized protein LOC135939530 n=1 Tax=Cloeon dipterum TaxID=197152 RepID=UPI0032201545